MVLGVGFVVRCFGLGFVDFLFEGLWYRFFLCVSFVPLCLRSLPFLF